MGFTHQELLKALPSAVEPYQCNYIDNRRVEFNQEGRCAVLSMGELKYRQIASLRLPVIDVKIEFDNFSEADYEAFIDRFKKYLHKGGG